MNNLSFRCPHCQNTVEITLESQAMVIVMDCAHCKTPLMYYYGEAFEVDRIAMGDLKQNQLKAVQGFLKVRGQLTPATAEPRAQSTELAANPGDHGTHHAGDPVRDSAIGKDDILDLMIDLETCQDVDEFLRRMG